MDSKIAFVDRILEVFAREGLLDHIIVVGSWCVYFYKHKYGEAFKLLSWRTKDIEFDTSLLGKAPKPPRDISKILKGLDFMIRYHGEKCYTTYEHPEIIIEFLVPQKGDGRTNPYKIPGFGINPQPLRFLSLLEEKVLSIDYNGLSIKVPHPAHYAIHKLIISKERRDREKAQRDRDQALAAWNMLRDLGEEDIIRAVVSGLSRKQKKMLQASLEALHETPRLETLDIQ